MCVGLLAVHCHYIVYMLMLYTGGSDVVDVNNCLCLMGYI